MAEKTIEKARKQITQGGVRRITWPGIMYDTTFLGVEADRRQHDEVRKWLEETLGPEWKSDYTDGTWIKDFSVIFFKNDSDLMMFKLKWV